MNEIHQLTSQIPAQSRAGTSFPLPQDVEETLDAFVRWLREVDGKTENTSNSYRSYVAKALFLGTEWKDLTSDQRSAVRALERFNSQA
jgi:hypothetical protein